MSTDFTRWLLAALLSVPALSSCIGSNVVARDDRAVVAAPAELQWVPAVEPIAPGLYESVEIRGEAAEHLWRIYYVFDASGRYTGAALIADGEQLEFQTLNGEWQQTPEGLALDGQPAVAMERAADHLRIETPSGSVILRRVELR